MLWQASLPQGSTAELMQNFIDRGGQIVFFPPESPASVASDVAGNFRGISWSSWQTAIDPISVATWKMDQDLLANSISGMSLPVGEIQTLRYCPPHGELTKLATLNGGETLLGRVPTSVGGVYFCSTTTFLTDSTLANNGAVLYVAVQRALENGAAVLGKARLATAGKLADTDLTTWQQQAGSENSLSTSFAYQAGVYQRGDRLLAINRAADENHADILSNEQIGGLFAGLDFSLVQNEVGTKSSLVQEIWRAFLVTMIFCLLAEALLCMPRKLKPQEEKNSIFRERAEREAIVKEMQGAA